MDMDMGTGMGTLLRIAWNNQSIDEIRGMSVQKIVGRCGFLFPLSSLQKSLID
jgi:hypothetical protein